MAVCGQCEAAERWSAVSDGGEDQGAEEVTVHGAEEGRIVTSVLEKSSSRASGSSFSARVFVISTRVSIARKFSLGRIEQGG